MGFLKSLIARISLDATDFQVGAKRVESTTDGLSRKFGKDLKNQIAGAFAVGAITAWVKSVADSTSAIKDLSGQANLTYKEVQQLQFAAQNDGLDFGDFATALTRLGQARKAAGEGNKEMREQLARYGITLEDIQNPTKRNIDLMMKMHDAMQGVAMTARDRSDFVDFFGRGGDKLISTLAEFKSNASKAPLISDADIESVDRLNKQLEIAEKRVRVLSAGVLGEVFNSKVGKAGKSTGESIREFFGGKPKDKTPPKREAEDIDLMRSRNGDNISGPLYNDKLLAEAKKAADKAELDLQNRILEIQFKSADADEKKRIIREKLAKLTAEIKNDEEKGKTDDTARESAAKKKLEVLELEQMLSVIGTDKPRVETTIPTDSLARTGGFVGGAESIMVNLQRDTLKAAQETAKNTKLLVDRSKNKPSTGGSILD